MWDRRRIVIRLWNLPGQSLRHRREIGPAYGAESLPLPLIRSAFRAEHRVPSEAVELILVCSTLISSERLKSFSHAALEQRHHRHVTIPYREDEQERDRRVDVAANRVIYREYEIERESQLDVMQQSSLATVFHCSLQPVILSAFDVVFRSAHKAGFDSEQSFQHDARV